MITAILVTLAKVAGGFIAGWVAKHLHTQSLAALVAETKPDADKTPPSKPAA